MNFKKDENRNFSNNGHGKVNKPMENETGKLMQLIFSGIKKKKGKKETHFCSI